MATLTFLHVYAVLLMALFFLVVQRCKIVHLIIGNQRCKRQKRTRAFSKLVIILIVPFLMKITVFTVRGSIFCC